MLAVSSLPAAEEAIGDHVEIATQLTSLHDSVEQEGRGLLVAMETVQRRVQEASSGQPGIYMYIHCTCRSPKAGS